jgi:putative salt-induced outer membrane protein YdiY
MLALWTSVAWAQDAPPAVWSGSAGAGLAFTSGNTDTSNINLSFKVLRDPKKTAIFSADALYLRGSKDGELAANNALLNTRVERKLGAKAYGFGQLQFLRDPFKAIDYFWAPTAGVGYRFYEGPKGRRAASRLMPASARRGKRTPASRSRRTRSWRSARS